MNDLHGRPLTTAELQDWVAFGAHWRPLQIGDDSATVELCQCTGEVVERRTSSDPQTIAYLRAHLPDGE